MGSLKLAAILLLLGSPVLVSSAVAQSAPTYGLGRTPSAEEIRARDINISSTGEELPPGRGTPKEGAKVFMLQGCVVCHGEEGVGGLGPALKSKTSQDLPIWKRERILPLRAPFATTVWDYIHRGMPLGREGTLTPDEVYALTAYLLYVNKVIPEDTVLDEKSLPKVKMPIGDDYARLPDWKPGTRRLKATLAIQPRLADGNVADGRGIDPRGVFIKDDKVGRFARHDYTGEILAALPSGIGRHHP